MSEVIPGTGLRIASFGESRAQLRDRLGDFRSFRRGEADNLIDHFPSEGLLLGFDDEDRLNFIEATALSAVEYSGVILVNRPFGEVITDLRNSEVEVLVDSSGAVLVGLGIGLYTPAPDEPDVEVAGVSITPLTHSTLSSGCAAGSPESTVRDESDSEDRLF